MTAVKDLVQAYSEYIEFMRLHYSTRAAKYNIDTVKIDREHRAKIDKIRRELAGAGVSLEDNV